MLRRVSASPEAKSVVDQGRGRDIAGIDPRAFKGFQTARLIGVGVAFLVIVVIVLCALLEMRDA